MIDVDAIRQRFEAVAPFLDERGRRLVAASEAMSAGHGGIAAVARATGVAPSTLGRGIKELAPGGAGIAGRVRRPGGGRKTTVAKDATLLSDLEALVEPTSQRRSAVAAALDLQELAPAGGGAAGAGSPGQPYFGG
jgi:transposase-like protein